ncbi:MAG: Hpt domain-containing protein [Desulfatiglandaceae bacterium]|jgi:histidine phosphotransfer protein HptB
MNIKKLAEGLGLEEEEYMEILELLVDSGIADIVSLEAAAGNNDAEEAVKAAHSLKGAAANMGLVELSEIAKVIEFKAREQDLTDMEENIKLLKVEFEPIVALVQA